MAKTRKKTAHHKQSSAAHQKSVLHKEVHPAISWAVLMGFTVIAILLLISTQTLKY